MAEILSTLSIAGQIQRVVEVPSGYIINGHLYDKGTMNPRPLDFYLTYGNRYDLATNQGINLRHSLDGYWGKTHGNSIIRDNYYPEIFYFFTNGGRGNENYAFKMRENADGSVDTITTVTLGANPSSYPDINQYAGQNRDWLYYTFNTGNAGNSYLVRMNKQTLVMETVKALGTYSIPTVMRETEQFIYYTWQMNKGDSYLWRHNKAANTNEDCKILLKSSTATKQYMSRFSDPIKISETSDYAYSLNHDGASNKHYIQKYIFDYTKADPAQVATEVGAAIDWGTTGFTEIKVLPTTVNFRYDLFITQANGKKYLNVSVNNASGASNTAQIPDLGIYTFLINDLTRDLTFKGFTQVASQLYRGHVGIKNNTFLVAATDMSMIYLKFNEFTEKFDVAETINTQPYFLGLDMSENIWVVNGAQEIEMISPFVPKDVQIKFERDAYKYQGTDINSYITIESKNYNNINIETNIELKLSGNAVFTSNGLKIITEKTITTGPKMIPITVKGSGSITVSPKLIL